MTNKTTTSQLLVRDSAFINNTMHNIKLQFDSLN